MSYGMWNIDDACDVYDLDVRRSSYEISMGCASDPHLMHKYIHIYICK